MDPPFPVGYEIRATSGLQRSTTHAGSRRPGDCVFAGENAMRGREKKRHIFCFVRRAGGVVVLYYALVFLIVGLVAGVLGATGVAAIASQIAWILFIIGIILLVIHLATGRRGPVI
jgi:uncharacterized membrane protein YtjA (UPF0391 family)